MHIVYLTEIPTPYRHEVFESMTDQSKDFTLTVVYLNDKQKNRSWALNDQLKSASYNQIFLKGLQLFGCKTKNFFINESIVPILKRLNPAVVVISGYAQPAFWQALLFCFFNKVPYFTVTESHALKKRSSILKYIKMPFLKFYYSKALAHLVMGKLSKKYVQSFDDQNPVVIFSNTVSIKKYSNTLRHNREISEPIRLLFVGHLEPWKGVEDLIKVCIEVFQLQYNVNLTLVGEGSLKSKLMSQIPYSLKERITFAGFVQPNDLAKYYNSSDGFILPSRDEPWGVVAIEALANHLPVLLSDKVGCHPDVVQPSMNGLVFQSGNTKNFHDQLCMFIETIGANGFKNMVESILQYDASVMAKNFLNSLSLVRHT